MPSKNEENTQKAIYELENLFLLDLIPESLEDAQEILQTAGIDTTRLKERGREILRDILSEFEDDWRNISEENIKTEASKILSRKLQSDLPHETLIAKIQIAIQILAKSGLSTALPAGVLHRNLEKETDQDLASLLRQIQFIAKEANIDLGEE